MLWLSCWRRSTLQTNLQQLTTSWDQVRINFTWVNPPFGEDSMQAKKTTPPFELSSWFLWSKYKWSWSWGIFRAIDSLNHVCQRWSGWLFNRRLCQSYSWCWFRGWYTACHYYLPNEMTPWSDVGRDFSLSQWLGCQEREKIQTGKVTICWASSAYEDFTAMWASDFIFKFCQMAG